MLSEVKGVCARLDLLFRFQVVQRADFADFGQFPGDHQNHENDSESSRDDGADRPEKRCGQAALELAEFIGGVDEHIVYG